MTVHEKLIKSLLTLDVGEWQIIGTPTNEDEFNASFKKVMSSEGIEENQPKEVSEENKEVSEENKDSKDNN